MLLTDVKREWRHRVAATMLGVLGSTRIGGAQQPVRLPPPRPAPIPRIMQPGPPLGFDSLDVRRLLLDAATAARAAPALERGSLLGAVARIQVEAGDFENAERTAELAAEPAQIEVLRQLGLWEWMAIIDRANPVRRVVCGLRAAGRPDDALAVVRRLPPGPPREWLLGHAAMSTMNPPYGDGAAPQRALPETTRARAALDIIHEIQMPAARLDALLMLMGFVSDTGPGVAVLRMAYDEARSIRLSDSDRQASRDALLAGQATRAGRSGDMPDLFARLTNLEDLRYVLHAVTGRRDDSGVARSFAPRVVAAGRAIADSAARTSYLADVHAALQRGVDREFADRLVPEARFDSVQSRAAGERIAREDARLAATYPEDLAKRALERGDYAEVRRQIERVPVGRSGAGRAAVAAELAWEAYMVQRDSALTLLDLGRASLRRPNRLASTEAAEFDGVIERLASIYFWLGHIPRGIETAALLSDLDGVADALRDWGASTFPRSPADSTRQYIDRAASPRVRDAALARFVEVELVPVDIGHARALADSIRTPESRVTARLAVANAFRRRGDTTLAKALFITVLSDSSLSSRKLGRETISALVALHAWRNAEAWARSANTDPAERARRLIAVATSLNSELLTRTQGYYMYVGNGPDPCLDVF